VTTPNCTYTGTAQSCRSRRLVDRWSSRDVRAASGSAGRLRNRSVTRPPPSAYRSPMDRSMCALAQCLVVLTVLAASACRQGNGGSGRRAGCETDGECERDERCIASACVPPEAIALCQAECPRTGGCTPRVRACVAEHESCNLGLRKVECLATRAEHCQRSARCRQEGRCTVEAEECVRAAAAR
jgi:hypothetical protein